jgi:hypothetical protein
MDLYEGAGVHLIDSYAGSSPRRWRRDHLRSLRRALLTRAHRAGDEFCAKNDVGYIVLSTGQSVILKQAPDV